MAPILAPTVKLNNGYEMPMIGIGASLAWHHGLNLRKAIDIGYRLIDTSYFSNKEYVVGEALRDKIDAGVIKREDIFVIAKLWRHAHEPERVEYACRKSLENLGLDYIDCFSIDWPYPYVYRGDDVYVPLNSKFDIEFSDVDYVDTWKAMEALVEKGLVKSIGVSDFNSKQLIRLLANCKIKPVLNQVECHLGLSQKPLIALCKQHGIVVTAYCPFGRHDSNDDISIYLFACNVRAIGYKYKKSPSQVILRYLIELGAVPLPIPVLKDRLFEYLNVFDFKLSPDDCKVLDAYNTGEEEARMFKIHC